MCCICCKDVMVPLKSHQSPFCPASENCSYLTLGKCLWWLEIKGTPLWPMSQHRKASPSSSTVASSPNTCHWSWDVPAQEHEGSPLLAFIRGASWASFSSTEWWNPTGSLASNFFISCFQFHNSFFLFQPLCLGLSNHPVKGLDLLDDVTSEITQHDYQFSSLERTGALASLVSFFLSFFSWNIMMVAFIFMVF